MFIYLFSAQQELRPPEINASDVRLAPLDIVMR